MPSKKSQCVKADKACLCGLSEVNRLEFKVCSIINIAVNRTASMTDLLTNTAYIAFLQSLTNRSHINRPIDVPRGAAFDWGLHAATYSAKSCSATTKFVSLSLIIIHRLRLIAILH